MEKKLIVDFYMWMVENDYDHNIRLRVEKKADMFLSQQSKEKPKLSAESVQDFLDIKGVRRRGEGIEVLKWGVPYAVSIEDIKNLLTHFAAQQNTVSDEEIKQKAFDLSYIFRDDDNCKRSDAVETYCEEMGYWMRNKLQSKQ